MNILGHGKQSWNRLSSSTKRRLAAIAILLILSNVAVWVIGFLVSRSHPILLGLLALAYGFGLRHAIDADHIAAIDNTTRKFIGEGKKPLTVGLYFALGHATIVIFLSLLSATAGSFVQHSFPFFKSAGFFIGASVSSIILLLIGIINLVSFFALLRTFKKVSQKKKYSHQHDTYLTIGFFSKLFTLFIHTVNESWHMYFVGFLFGLGFDTASEIGLLSLSVLNGISGASPWIILLLPLAFTAGMTLIDTLDGIMMLGMYGWAYIKPARKLYYNLNITLFSVFIAFLIGGIQVVTLISKQFNVHTPFFQFFNSIDFGAMGYLIIGLFIIFWIVSISIYKIKRYDKLL